MLFELDHINFVGAGHQEAHVPGWAIVDTGTKTPGVLAAWRQLIAAVGPLAATPQDAHITRILRTYMRADPCWLTRKFSSRLWMTQLQYRSCRTLADNTGREALGEAFGIYR